MTRTNSQAPIVGFTPIRLPGSPGATITAIDGTT